MKQTKQIKQAKQTKQTKQIWNLVKRDIFMWNHRKNISTLQEVFFCIMTFLPRDHPVQLGKHLFLANCLKVLCFSVRTFGLEALIDVGSSSDSRFNEIVNKASSSFFIEVFV